MPDTTNSSDSKKARKEKRRKVLAFLLPYRKPLILSIVLTVGLTVIGMISPLLMRRLINDVAGAGMWDMFPFLIIGLFAVPVLTHVVSVFNGIVLNRVGIRLIGSTRKRIFDHLMRLSLAFYNEMSVGNIKERLFGDVATVSTAATGGLIAAISDVATVTFALVVMLRLSLPLSILTIAITPLFLLNYRFFSKRIRTNAAVLRSRMDHISTMLQERLGAHELIQSYGQEKKETVHFSSHAKQVMEASVQGSTYSVAFNQIAAFINKIGNTLIYCAGCFLFIKGLSEYGDIVAFCSYVALFIGPVIRLSSVANQFVSIGVSVDRIHQVLDRQPLVRDAEDAASVIELSGDVAVQGVTFSYAGGEAVLRNVNLEIPAASHIAVVGASGAGRSTLAALLRRFYEPDAGAILADGKDIRSLKLKDYREKVALVIPESTIFDGTLRYNLVYGNPDATEEQIRDAVKAVGLSELVDELSSGLETILGAGGLKVSAGNRQRIGLARALISNPVILITDEATTALDPISAEEVNESLRKVMAGRTYIMIVHRMLMAKSTDNIYVLEDGMLLEQGKFDELVKKEDGIYRALLSYQYGDAILDGSIGDEGRNRE